MIVVGDVHGCIDELMQLVNQLKLTERDLLIFAGDLLHKGPASADVVRYVRALATRYHVVLIWGNHEEKHIRWIKHEAEARESGKKNPMSHCEEYPPIQAELSENDVEFLRNGYMYYRFWNHIVVHGGIPGCVRELERPYRHVNDQKKIPKNQRWILRQMYRLRYEDERGQMVSMGDEVPEHRFWAAKYDGRFGHAFFGHQPFMQGIREFPWATALDTGCVHGGYLTAVEVKPDNSRHYHQVQAKREYQARKKLMNRNPEEDP